MTALYSSLQSFPSHAIACQSLLSPMLILGLSQPSTRLISSRKARVILPSGPAQPRASSRPRSARTPASACNRTPPLSSGIASHSPSPPQMTTAFPTVRAHRNGSAARSAVPAGKPLTQRLSSLRIVRAHPGAHASSSPCSRSLPRSRCSNTHPSWLTQPHLPSRSRFRTPTSTNPARPAHS